MILKIILSIFSLIIFFTGCAPKIEQKPHISKANLQKVSWEELNGFKSDDINISLDVFKKGCTKSIKNKNLKEVCELSQKIKDPKEFFTKNFIPFKLIGDNGEKQGLITGYYEPILNGSLKKTDIYKYAIYQTPKDLLTIDLSNIYPELKNYRLRGKLVGNRVIPYESRQDIEKENSLTPICYVDNKVDLFFLHIQGSGKVKLEDGTIINVGYANQNGRVYYAIGKKLIEEGHIKKENISLQSIKKYFEKNPNRVDEILNLNESYIFFHRSKKQATGSLGVELVANRNLAVDREYIPLGFPVFIDTTEPIKNNPIRQLMVAADTGGAIKGEIRADFFFGNGDRAKELAGKMKQKGSLYILIPTKKIKQDQKQGSK